MARKFMFVCFGLLALAVTFHLGAQYGQAGYVDHSTTGIVAVGDQGTNGALNYLLLDNGEVWSCPFGTWVLLQHLPVAVSDIKFFGRSWFVTSANEYWIGGQNYGAPPGVVATHASTWGSIKAQFNK